MVSAGVVLVFSLPETNIFAPENGWLEDDVGRLVSFWEGLFSGAMLVSVRVFFWISCKLAVQSFTIQGG